MDRYRVTDGAGFRLADHDPADRSGFLGTKSQGRERLAELAARLDERQEQLHAGGEHRVLVVLQGMDTAGKGGTVRHVFEGVNPAGVRVVPFGVPTSTELARDFLWRVHAHVPADGQIAVFDRSHYEDVLVARVHELVPAPRWKARYRHIRDFERMLTDEGTTICKLFLHVSRDRQRERLQARVDRPDKHWKFSPGDLEERRFWADYQEAYEAMVRETAVPEAPWYVVPADRKWYRNLVVAEVLVDTLDRLDLGYPPPAEDLTGVVVT